LGFSEEYEYQVDNGATAALSTNFSAIANRRTAGDGADLIQNF